MADEVRYLVVREERPTTRTLKAVRARRVRARSSSPSVPSWKAPAQNLLLWLRADAGVRGAGGKVASWTDATGLQAVQPQTSSQPALVPNAWAGRPAVRFDGADDHLELPAGSSDFRAGLTVFVVARVEAGPLWMRFLDLGKGPQADNIFFGQGKVTLYRNGAAVGAGTTSVPAPVVRKPNYVGRSNYGGSDPTLKGDLFEMMLLGRAISDPERAYIETYLALKYLDPTAPPALVRPQEK